MDSLNIKSTLRQGLLAGAAIVGLMGATTDANAAAYALSQMTISNLLFTASPAQAFGGTFNFIGRTSVGLNAASSSNSDQNAAAPFSFSSIADCVASPAVCVDPTRQFLTSSGHSTPGENAFAVQGKGGSYAYSDGIITDTLINTSGGTPAGGGGDWRQIAEASVGIGNAGSAQSGQTEQNWDFAVGTLSAGQIVSVTLDATILAIVDTLDADALQASADSRFAIELVSQGGGATGASASLGVLTFGLLKGKGFSQTTSFTTTGLTLSLTAATAGDYLFRITSNSTATALAEVPEPATLSLMGLGLLGLGYAARRRRKQS
jgi:hypothetical protein